MLYLIVVKKMCTMG